MTPYLYICGQRWIRTTEGVRQQIYSLPHLATLVFAHYFPLVGLAFAHPSACRGQASKTFSLFSRQKASFRRLLKKTS